MAARKQRGTLELRPLSIELGPLPHAQHDGSAIVSMGPVKALAAVSGPSEVRIRDEKTNSAALDVHYTPLQGMAGGTTSTSFAQAVEGIAQAVLMLHLFPRSLVTLHLNTYASPPSYTAHRLQHASQRPPTTPPAVQPPHPDAAIPAALQAAHINAVTCACLDAAASIGMRAMVAAVSAAVLRKDVRANLMHGWRAGEVAPEYSSGAAAGASDDEDEDLFELILDPSPYEESLARSTHVFAFAFERQVKPRQQNEQDNAMDKGSASDVPAALDSESSHDNTLGTLVYNSSQGLYAAAEHLEALGVCRSACRDIVAQMRKAVAAQRFGGYTGA